MKPLSLAPETFTKLCEEYARARHGHKQAVVEFWATRLGCNPGSLRNIIRRGWLAKPKELQFPEAKREACAHVIAHVSRAEAAMPNTRIPVTQTIAMLEDTGRIPRGSVNPREVATFRRRFRIGADYRITRRFRRTNPNALHQFDFSVSRALRYAGPNLVQIRSDFVYENRPNDDRLRVWISSMIDSASGIIYAQYFLSRGEDTRLAVEAMRRAWMLKDEFPFWGVPHALYADRASWGKTQEVGNLLDKLGVARIPAQTSWAKGQVERSFKKIKEELEGCALGQMARGTVLSLDYVNSVLVNYCKTVAVSPHPDGGTRLEHWRKVQDLWFPDNFTELAYRQIPGTVRHGKITHEGKDYYAPTFCMDGQKVELVKLDGRLYLFIPATAQISAKRILLEEARLNIAPPEDAFGSRMRELVGSIKPEPFSADEIETMFETRIPHGVDFTPPPATRRTKIAGPGIELLHEDAQRKLIADLLQRPLGALPEELKQTLNIFCATPRTKEEVEREAFIIQAEIISREPETVRSDSWGANDLNDA